VDARPPANGNSFERRDNERDPPARRRRTLVAAGSVGSAVILTLAALALTRGSGHGATTLPALGIEPTETSVTTTKATPTSIVIPPVEIQLELGAAVIAEHIMCNHEDKLTGDSIEAVRAAVAADNDNPSEPGGTPKPFAHDARAQSEIVRASIQALHEAKTFYAHCKPAPAGATVTTETEGSSVPESRTLPPSR
jgi:hypothetical protein